MTDADLVAKKLAFIETCVRELRELARPDDIERDVREQRFVAHTLQVAIQAALDVASHIVADDHLGEPDTNIQLFDLLARDGWLPEAMSATMGRMAGFRNIVVHGYEAIDLKIVRDIVETRLNDFIDFASAIRSHME
jgi:uncharacterized protein YutE (UPF0331/DUF86 family)